MPEYKWHPIEDIPEELYNYTDPDLLTLAEEWQAVQKETSDEILEKILNEIKREWAIETGKIEGLYTLSRGITKTLIQHGISAKLIPHNSTNLGPNELTRILEDQYEVIEGLMDYVGQRKTLTLHYIRQMHEVFTRHQDTTEGVREDGAYVQVSLLKGDWKKWSNNPEQKDKTIHEYCPPEQVQIEMEHLLELHKKHEERNVRPEVEAAFLHHRFTQIHPFQDGNGRVARALASLVLLQANYFPFVVSDEERAVYIDALEEADRKNLDQFVTFVVEKQKDLLYRALRESQEIDISNSLSELDEDFSGYFEKQTNYKNQLLKATKIISLWRDDVEDILKKHNEKIKEYFQSSEGQQIEIEKSITTTGKVLPPFTEMVGSWIEVDINIVFPNHDYYVLTLFPSQNHDSTINLFAKLMLKHEKEISTFELSISSDYRLADLNFRNWFNHEFSKLFQKWLQNN